MDVDVDEDEGPIDRPQAGEFDDEPPCTERKEYRQLTTDEIARYQSAIQTLKTTTTGTTTSQYDTLVAYHHSRMSPAAHFGPAFFTWHRIFLIWYVFGTNSAILARCNVVRPTIHVKKRSAYIRCEGDIVVGDITRNLS